MVYDYVPVSQKELWAIMEDPYYVPHTQIPKYHAT